MGKACSSCTVCTEEPYCLPPWLEDCHLCTPGHASASSESMFHRHCGVAPSSTSTAKRCSAPRPMQPDRPPHNDNRRPNCNRAVRPMRPTQPMQPIHPTPMRPMQPMQLRRPIASEHPPPCWGRRRCLTWGCQKSSLSRFLTLTLSCSLSSDHVHPLLSA